MMRLGAIVALLAASITAQAQLTVTVSPPKVTGSRSVVPLALKNNLSEKVESARAVCFLLDAQGKIAGQATRWVIGGTNTNGLAAGATNGFHFVIPTERTTSTNLTAKVSFSRVVLEGGKLADVTKDVQIHNASK